MSSSRKTTHPDPPPKAGVAVMLADWIDRWRDVARAKPLGDVLAGIPVAAVALPLNVGLAVACGLPPVAGLISGALGGFIAAAFGGAPLLVTGPAAALSFMVLDINTHFGVAGVAATALIVGVIEVILTFTGAGKLMAKVPESVLAGFTTGVGIKLFDQQIPNFLGFPDIVDAAGSSTGKPVYQMIDIAQMMHRPAWLHHVSLFSIVCGLFVAFLVVAAARFKRFPAAILGIGLITFVSTYLHWDIERVGTIPSVLPSMSLPLVPDEQWLDLAAKALPLALLAAVESLLTARAIDRMVPDQKPHNPNLELFGQGLANLAVGFFSGMPVTGVVARSGVNVQSGGRTRLASMLHAVILLLSVLYLGNYISQVPVAALAGLLCVVAYRLMELKTFAELFHEDKIEAAAFVATAVGTITGHLVTGMVVGLLLHAVARWMHRRSPVEIEHNAQVKARGVRAILKGEQALARKHQHAEASPKHLPWLQNIRGNSLRARSAFVHPAATVIGRVMMGEHVHVAAGTSVRADEGSPFFIGSNTNIQDGVILHALKDKRVAVGSEEWAIYVGKNVSIAHNAIVHGPCYIGDDTFIGFKAVVHDAVVGANCFIGIGAIVVGVEIPDGRHVPHGTLVDTADAVDRLPMATHSHGEFNEDVVDVNRGLAVAYRVDDDSRQQAQVMRLAEPKRNAPAWTGDWGGIIDKERF